MNFYNTFDDALEEASSKIEAIQQNYVSLIGEALVMLAEETMAYAKEFTVPVYTGYLRSTGWVDPEPTYGPASIEIALGFSADYAEQQEIDGNKPGYRRDRPLAGRRYMRRAMLHTMADAEAKVANYIRERMSQQQNP